MSARPEPRLWPAAAVAAGDAPESLRTILGWCHDFLVAPHPELGRTGPVCPYTAPALRQNLLYLAELPQVTDIALLADVVGDVRRRYQDHVATLPAQEAELVSYLLVLPDFPYGDSAPLDALQLRVKDEFVAEGLMVGQFHPVCPNPGLWNEDFRPLRAPVPLLAIRKMLVFDLPFLTTAAHHLDAWLERYAPQLPPRVRAHLAARVVPV